MASVTLTYPPGCREVTTTRLTLTPGPTSPRWPHYPRPPITPCSPLTPCSPSPLWAQVGDEIGADELVRRLKTLAHTFQVPHPNPTQGRGDVGVRLAGG